MDEPRFNGGAEETSTFPGRLSSRRFGGGIEVVDEIIEGAVPTITLHAQNG